MSAKTRSKDAAEAAVRAARDRFAERPVGTPRQMIARRMLIETNAAVLVGLGELQDLGLDIGSTGETVVRVMAGAFGSLVMTLASGDEQKALHVLPMLLKEFGTTVEERMRARDETISTKVEPAAVGDDA